MDRGYDTRSPIQKKSSLPRIFTLFRAYLFFVFLIFCLSIFLVIASAPLFQIRSVTVSGGIITPSASLQMYVAKILEGDRWTIFPYDSIVSIPLKTIQRNILETFPSVASLRIERVGFSQLAISIIERVPTQVFCKEEECLLVDVHGVIFAVGGNSMDLERLEGSPSEFLRRSMTASSDKLIFGAPLLPGTTSISLHKVRKFLTSHGFEVVKTSLLPLGFFDVLVKYPNSQNMVEFRFRDTKKIDVHISELHLALEKGLREKIINNTVEYVISYVPQKVIYKNIDK